jgi:fluoride ion exporter CrcB/FEX
VRARRLLAIGVGAVAGGALRWLALSGLGGDPYVALLLVNTAASGLLGWLQAAVHGGRWVRRDAAGLVAAWAGARLQRDRTTAPPVAGPEPSA